MKNRPLLLALALVALQQLDVDAQIINEPDPIRSYYYDYKIANPAFAGTKDKHTFTSVYSGIPGSAIEMAYGTYELNLKSIKGGIGAVAAFEEVGPNVFAHYGMFFSKQLPFNENAGLHIGTQLFYQSHKIRYDMYRFIEPSDPLLTSSNSVDRFANFDLGAVYYSPLITIGASVKNAIKRTSNFGVVNEYVQEPTYTLILSKDLKITEQVKATPSALIVTDLDDTRYHVNSTFEFINWVMLGGGYTLPEKGRSGSFNLNAGVNIKNWVQIVQHVYSSNPWSDTDPLMETLIRARIPYRSKEN